MKTVRIFILVAFLLYGRSSMAHVIISEIAWMGTISSANAEWIELYNPDDTSYTINDWVLHARDGSPSIRLLGEIAAKSYWLLERSSDTTLPDITADQVYTGSLGNTGEDLLLTDENGELVDEISQQEAWEAGNNATKETMQLSKAGVWITAEGTPGKVNSETDRSEAVVVGDNTNVAENTSDVAVLMEDKTVKKELIDPDPVFNAQVVIPGSVVAGSPISLKALVTHTGNKDFVTGRFDWYFGDGSAYRLFQNKEFDYIYTVPGDYVVVLEYFSNEIKETVDAVYRKKIKVVDNNLNISLDSSKSVLVIENNAKDEVDLFGWELRYGNQHVVFPKYTLISGKGRRVFSLGKLKIKPENVNSCALVDTVGTIVARCDTIQS